MEGLCSLSIGIETGVYRIGRQSYFGRRNRLPQPLQASHFSPFRSLKRTNASSDRDNSRLKSFPGKLERAFRYETGLAYLPEDEVQVINPAKVALGYQELFCRSRFLAIQNEQENQRLPT